MTDFGSVRLARLTDFSKKRTKMPEVKIYQKMIRKLRALRG
jgi:hypothetical protein